MTDEYLVRLVQFVLLVLIWKTLAAYGADLGGLTPSGLPLWLLSPFLGSSPLPVGTACAVMAFISLMASASLGFAIDLLFSPFAMRLKNGCWAATRIRKIRALDHLSLCIQQGEFVSYAGSNGAGKSTTIKLLSGILQPTDGTVSVLQMNPVGQ